MTTLVVQLPLGLATRVARVADRLGVSHDDLARLALRLFCRASTAADEGPTNQPTNQRKAEARSMTTWNTS